MSVLAILTIILVLTLAVVARNTDFEEMQGSATAAKPLPEKASAKHPAPTPADHKTDNRLPKGIA